MNEDAGQFVRELLGSRPESFQFVLEPVRPVTESVQLGLKGDLVGLKSDGQRGVNTGDGGVQTER